ncbi:hypothetical protein TNCV_3094111 [Trichonephila clavipes]|nr:hypothetical protein TNCV_3094111 [Trichonephila clavipes]
MPTLSSDAIDVHEIMYDDLILYDGISYRIDLILYETILYNGIFSENKRSCKISSPTMKRKKNGFLFSPNCRSTIMMFFNKALEVPSDNSSFAGGRT